MLDLCQERRPYLEPCPELLDALRTRLRALDEHIDTLARSRQVLHDYVEATERRVPRDSRMSGAE
ncbi:hypothetical protein GCM10023080_070740 [Streptomyces pseudoechinosporeus]